MDASHKNLALIGQAVSEKMFEYYGNIHVYCPGVRPYKPLGHDLYTHCSILAINASCEVSLKSVHQFQSRRFLKVFYRIWAWRPSWSCNLDYLYTH